jgi:NADH-quinone oxidoreductase subunit J
MTSAATPFFFYLLAALAIAGSILVVTRRKAAHAALALLVTLLALAGLYLMLYAPFVAGVQIAVFAAVILSLFLFVIVLMNLQRPSHSVFGLADRDFSRIWPLGLLAGLALASSFTYIFVKNRAMFPDRMVSFPESSNTQQIAGMLYGEKGHLGPYIFPLEITSLLLVSAIVGAAILVESSRPEITTDTKERVKTNDQQKGVEN